MSSRTVNARKAVLKAWELEAERVAEGKGTRDWTREQQQDILENGIAHDEDGKAFQGQHMKSVEQYPDYQGDPGNIQFLTRAEHLEAHKGSWQTPCNWYYDPVTKEMHDFGDNIYTPCKVIMLSDPVIVIEITPGDTVYNKKADIGDSPSTGTDPPTTKAKSPPNASAAHHTSTPRKSTVAASKPTLKETIKAGIKNLGNEVKDFPVKHPILTTIGKGIVLFVGGLVIERLASNQSSGNGGGGGSSISSTYDSDDEGVIDDAPVDEVEAECEDDDKKLTRAPHHTSSYTRHRYGKEEHVRGYNTGENRDE